MKLRDTVTGRVFNVERDVGELLLSIGEPRLEVAVEPAPKGPKQPAIWCVVRNSRNEEPVLQVTCHTCKQTANYMGPTAHLTQKFFHCGIVGGEAPPKDVAKEYEKLAERYHGKIPLAKKVPFLKPFTPEFLK